MSDKLNDFALFDELQVLDSDDIDTPNRCPPPGWSQVVYRLGTGAFRYFATRVDLGGGVGLEHARFVGATRLVGALQADAVHILYPYGRDLRLRGVAAGQHLVVVTPPGASFEGATQAEGCGRNIVMRGSAYAELCTRLKAATPLSHWCVEQTVFAPTPASEALREELESYFELLARRPELALQAQAKEYARTNFVDLAGQALESLLVDPPCALEASSISSRALALAAERWIWARIGDEGAPPVSLGASARALGYSVRRVQQAIEEHFGISFVKFVRAARLHQAHAALLRDGGRVSVTAVATRYGFWHMGRFSSYYREMFGQPPSRTAKAAWRSAARLRSPWKEPPVLYDWKWPTPGSQQRKSDLG